MTGRNFEIEGGGYLTRGDTVLLRATLYNGETAVSVLADDMKAIFPNKNGQNFELDDTSFTQIESGGSDVGVVDIELENSDMEKLPVGKDIPFQIVSINGSLEETTYWGKLSLVRD